MADLKVAAVLMMQINVNMMPCDKIPILFRILGIYTHTQIVLKIKKAALFWGKTEGACSF